MRACIFSLRVRRERRCIAAVPRREFITSISFVYITRSIQIDSLSELRRWRRREDGLVQERQNLFPQRTFDKNNNSAIASAVFRRNNNNGGGAGNIMPARACASAIQSVAKILFHLSGLISAVTTETGALIRECIIQRWLKMAVLWRSMRDQYLTCKQCATARYKNVGRPVY